MKKMPGALSQKMQTVGMADKIWDLTPEYIFVNEALGSIKLF